MLVYNHVRAQWADQVVLKPDTAALLPGEPFVAVAVQSLATVDVCGLRYGAATNTRGRKSCYAYMDSRQAVRIDYLFHVTHQRDDPAEPPITTTCAVVRAFRQNDAIPEMPWALRWVLGWFVDLLPCMPDRYRLQCERLRDCSMDLRRPRSTVHHRRSNVVRTLRTGGHSAFGLASMDHHVH